MEPCSPVVRNYLKTVEEVVYWPAALMGEEAPMRRKRTKLDVLPTIWRVPDDLWQKIQPLLEAYDPPKPTGRKRIDARSALDAIIFRRRSG